MKQHSTAKTHTNIRHEVVQVQTARCQSGGGGGGATLRSGGSDVKNDFGSSDARAMENGDRNVGLLDDSESEYGDDQHRRT